MKVGGVDVSSCEEVLVLPRLNGDLVFRAHAVDSMDEFNTLCPRPEPPTRITKNGKEPHESDAFLKELESWQRKRHAYICVKSLEPSDIEWDGVDLKKPGTWEKWIDELRKAGISDVEVGRIQVLVLDANSLNEAKLKLARESFLAGQGKA